MKTPIFSLLNPIETWPPGISPGPPRKKPAKKEGAATAGYPAPANGEEDPTWDDEVRRLSDDAPRGRKSEMGVNQKKTTLELYQLHHLWCFSGYVGRIKMILDSIKWFGFWDWIRGLLMIDKHDLGMIGMICKILGICDEHGFQYQLDMMMMMMMMMMIMIIIIIINILIYIHALSLAGLGVHVSSLSESMNAFILAQVELSQNSIHCCFFPGPGKGWPS